MRQQQPAAVYLPRHLGGLLRSDSAMEIFLTRVDCPPTSRTLPPIPGLDGRRRSLPTSSASLPLLLSFLTRRVR